MKKLLLILVLLLPIFLNAQTIEIDERKNDIYFANGIMNTRDDARKSLALIYETTKKEVYGGSSSAMFLENNFDILYNTSYGKYADLLEAFNQKKAEHKYYWIA